MQPITLEQSEKVIDAITEALGDQNTSRPDHYTMADVIYALNLRVALEFYNFGPGEKFQEGVRFYRPPPWTLSMLFDRISLLEKGTTTMKPEFARLESPSSFAQFCGKMGKVPDYWKKVYARLGIAWHDGFPYIATPAGSPPPKAPPLLGRLFGRG